MTDPLRMLPVVTAVILGATFTAPSRAEAIPPPREGEPEPSYFGATPTWFALTGVTGGGTIGGRAGGAFLGLEASIVRMHRGLWMGGYADAFYDFGADAPTVTLGPEIGLWFVGIDGGLAARSIDGGGELGAAGRLNLTAGVVSAFGRYVYWPGDVGAEHVFQAGFVLKLPVWESD